MAGAAPVTALLLGVVVALVAAGGGAPRQQVGRLLLAALEVLLPLAVAMTAVSIVARDGCRELQLSLPTRYPGTLARRLGVLALAGTLGALVFSAALGLTGWWTGPRSPAAPLVWLAPTLGLAGLAVLVGVLGRGPALATTVVAGIWLGELLFADWFGTETRARPFFLFTTVWFGVEDWWPNRLTLTALGLVAVGAVAALLHRPHLLLTEEER